MKMNKKASQKFQTETFNTLVREESQKRSIFADNVAFRYERSTLLSFMQNLSTSSVLDIGCGTGRFAIPIAKIAKHVVGIDTSDDSIKVFRAEVKKQRLKNITGHVMDFRDLANKGEFDYVLLVNVVHHVPEIHELLEKIRKILRKNGTLVIFEFNPLNLLYVPWLICYKQAFIHMNKEYFRSNIWTLGRILDQAGYSVVSDFRYAFLPTVLYNVSPIFMKINSVLNSIPLLNELCAFHILRCKIRK